MPIVNQLVSRAVGGFHDDVTQQAFPALQETYG